MNNLYIKYLLLLPLYVMIQVLILNEILFSTYINPFLYLILIISLPLEINKLFILSYAFLLGLSVDLLSSSLGFHSTATVLIAFLKPFIAKFTIPHNILSDNDEINTMKIGVKSYIIFAICLIIIHNICLFFTEYLEFNSYIFMKILLSSIVTFVLIYIAQILIYVKK